MNKKIPINRLNKFLLYGLFCPINKDIKYIGITTGSLKNRLLGHLRAPTNGKISHWFTTLKKDSLIPEIKLIKECVSYEELLSEEIIYIKKYRELGFELFNIADGGDINPMFGKTHSKEAREKISKIHKGRKMSDEVKKNHIINIYNFWHSEETLEKREKIKEKMSERMIGNSYAKGSKHSDEVKRIIQEKRYKYGNVGYKHTEETRKEMSNSRKGENNPMFGKTLSEESINKRNKTIKKNKTFKDKNNPNYKYNIERYELFKLFIEEDKTQKELSLIFGCSEANITRLLKKFEIKKGLSNKYNFNYDDLYKLYITDCLTQSKIAEIYNTSNKYISKILKKYNIKKV